MVILNYLFSTFLFLCCTDYTITRDTVSVFLSNTNDVEKTDYSFKAYNAVLCQNNLYLNCSYNHLSTNNASTFTENFVLVIDNRTLRQKNETYFIPGQYDLYQDNDTVFYKNLGAFGSEHSDQNYYYDYSVNNWVKTDTLDNVVFRDKSWNIMYETLGGWGYHHLWFINKPDHNQYLFNTDLISILKDNSIYYIADPWGIIAVPHPEEGYLCDESSEYKRVPFIDKFDSYDFSIDAKYPSPSYLLISPEVNGFQSTNDYDSFGNRILREGCFADFFNNGRKMQIITAAKGEVYLYRFKKGKIQLDYSIKEDIRFIYDPCLFRGNRNSSNGTALVFITSDNHYGIMTIQNRRIRFIYLKII